MSGDFTESVVVDAALAWLASLGYAFLHLPAPQSIASRQAGGPDIAAGMLGAERSDRNYRGVLREAARMTPVCVLSP